MSPVEPAVPLQGRPVVPLGWEMGLKAALSCGVGIIRRIRFLPCLTAAFSPRVLQCDSLFQDLAKLKSRPAHLGVFLRYIFSQADPSPLVRPYRHKIGGETSMGQRVRGPAGR